MRSSLPVPSRVPLFALLVVSAALAICPPRMARAQDALAVADAHSVHGNGVGGWRMYLPSKTDEPAKIDWTGDLAAQALKGHIMLTTHHTEAWYRNMRLRELPAK